MSVPVWTKQSIKLVEEIILSQENQPGTHSTPAEINIWTRYWLLINVLHDWSRPWSLSPKKTQDAKTYWLENWKAFDPFKKVTVKVYSEKTAFFSDNKVFKKKQLYNSQSNVVYVLKKMRKVRDSRGKIFQRNWSLFRTNKGFCCNIDSWLNWIQK